MKNILTFIIPIRHQENAKDWQRVKRVLSETVRSIARQTSEGWKAVIVANHGAELPELPEGFEVKRVDFPPNQFHSRGSAELHSRGSVAEERFHEALRMDRGRRVLAGMLHAGEMGHVMIVDDDDFVSCQLTAFTAANRTANGWYIFDGYIWSDGGRLLYRYSDFSRFCGSSHVVRADLYGLPPSLEAADETYISRMLGSHIFLQGHLAAAGTPLEKLPFPGAIYRIGHAESHSQHSGIIQRYFRGNNLLKRPKELCRRLSRLRVKNRRLEEEFFGRK
jgi:hypothetical protein